MYIIFQDFLIFYQTFFSRQVKRSVVISNKHSIYELPHELLNDLRLRILGSLTPPHFRRWGGSVPTQEKKKTQDLRKLGKIRKISKLYRIITQCLALPPNPKFFLYQQKTAEKQKLKFSRIARVCLLRFFHDCDLKLKTVSHYGLSNWINLR